MANVDRTTVMKRRREIYDEQASMLIAILLEQKRKFLVGERTGKGISSDPYIRQIEYYGSSDDEKQINRFMEELTWVGRKRD